MQGVKDVTALGPRERLVRSARRLTYRDGVNVGVDAILEDAGVARRSLYQHFGSKDQLVAEVLRQSLAYDQVRYTNGLDAGGDDPRQRIEAFLDGLEATVKAEGYRGCRYLAAELGLPDPDHPAHEAIRDYRRWRHELFANELRNLGHPDPAQAASQLVMLIDGVFVEAGVDRDSDPVAAMRPLVATILDAARQSSRSRKAKLQP
jgi:AcrR family transcriptional regulator